MLLIVGRKPDERDTHQEVGPGNQIVRFGVPKRLAGIIDASEYARESGQMGNMGKGRTYVPCGIRSLACR